MTVHLAVEFTPLRNPPVVEALCRKAADTTAGDISYVTCGDCRDYARRMLNIPGA